MKSISDMSARYIVCVQKYETAKAAGRFGLADDYAVAARSTSGWLIHNGMQESTISDLREQALAAMDDSNPIEIGDQDRPELTPF